MLFLADLLGGRAVTGRLQDFGLEGWVSVRATGSAALTIPADAWDRLSLPIDEAVVACSGAVTTLANTLARQTLVKTEEPATEDFDEEAVREASESTLVFEPLVFEEPATELKRHLDGLSPASTVADFGSGRGLTGLTPSLSAKRTRPQSPISAKRSAMLPLPLSPEY